MSRVLLLCNRTRHMADPWLDAGYMVTTVDLQPADVYQRGRDHVIADVRDYKPDFRPRFAGAFPPCTDVAVSGAKHFKNKGVRALANSLLTLAACIDICNESDAGFIENPVSVFASYWRKPDYYFHPSDYTGFCLGDNYTKKTCLWAFGKFVMPSEFKAPCFEGIKPDDRIHKAPPSTDRGDIRSETPKGFARAVFEANHIRQKSEAA